MASYNRVVLVGNVTRDVELKYAGTGTALCDLGLAVNERSKVNGEYKDEVSFFDATCFGRTAEVAGEFAHKGSNVLVEGRLKQDTWQDKDGNKRSKVKILVDRLVLLGKKGESNGGQQNAPSSESPGESGESGEDVPW